MSMTNPSENPMLLPALLLAAAAAALGTAYTAQWGFGYEPCVLCLYQRLPYAAIAALGLAAAVWRGAGAQRTIALLAGLTFLVSAAIAGYHVGVEQQWWASAASCGGDTSFKPLSTDDFMSQLRSKPEKSCGDIDWTLFGVSMATYNAVVSAVLAAAVFAGWRRRPAEETR